MRCWKVPHKDLNKGDNLALGPVPLQPPNAVAILSANGSAVFKGSCASSAKILSICVFQAEQESFQFGSKSLYVVDAIFIFWGFIHISNYYVSWMTSSFDLYK